MSVGLDGMARDLYDQLTAVTFFVVDTEFSTHDDEHHLISIAVVPVIGGRRTKASHELYRVMNPGVPIDTASSAIHGFTDASVTGKRSFAFYAATICERLREDGAVFVCHNPIDAHVLRRELVRLDEQAATTPPGSATVGLAALPDLPIIDTQRLAVAVGYPGVGRNHQLSLDQLCDLTGLKRTAPAHDARNDARDTADTFIRLVRYAAEHTVFWTADDLLGAGAAGTLHAPTGASHLGPKHRTRTPLPADHIARHTTPLLHPVTAGSDEAHAWLVLAGECATLRCPYLADEAAVTAPFNAHALLRPLMDDLPHLVEPGQAATLLAAVHAFLTAEPAAGVPPVLVQAGLLKWWRVARDVIAATPRCDRRDPNTCCPACAEGEPCPRDTVGVPLAERVALGERGVMDEARVRELTSPAVKGSINTWRKHHPDVLGYALWRAATYLLAQERDEDAFVLVDRGIALGVHLVEPRLGHLACQRLLENGDPTGALAAANTLLGRKTTDAAYDDVADWAAFTHNTLYAQAPPAPRVISHPRRARPAGLAHPRRYT